MVKLRAAILKEIRQLKSDFLGLIMLFVLPVILVLIITLVQDSAYRIVNENNISVLIGNDDEGGSSQKLIELLDDSKMFIVHHTDVSEAELKDELLAQDMQMALYISPDFSEKLEAKAKSTSDLMMSELGVTETVDNGSTIQSPELDLYYDPVLQDNFTLSIVGILNSYLSMVESELMISSVFAEMEMETPPELMENMKNNQVAINRIPAQINGGKINPNSTQHNVPAWTIFAMFFMVISLGGNIVNERTSGSFQRLKTLPTSFGVVLTSKVVVFVVVALLQLTLIFSLGKFLFPVMGLPTLVLPSNIIGFILISILCSLSAVSFALLIGTYTKSQVQANGIGAVLVIIFAAIGGVWVPLFIMPDYMQTIGSFSPLYWCLEGFYILFLEKGDWMALLPVITFLVIFIFTCQFLTILKLRIEKLI